MTELFPTPATVVSAYVTVTSPSQLSLAVAGPLVSAGNVLASHSIVVSAGESIKIGAVVSATVIV